MKTDKWLYFRNIGTVGGDDGIVGTNYSTPTSGCYPASRIMNMHPTDDTTLRVCLKPVKFIDNGAQYNTAHGYHACDFVDINLNANNKHKEVIDAINSAMTNARTPFIVIGDDVTGEYIHTSISSMENIVNHRFQPGEGMHEYFEVIATSTSANGDGKVAAQLDIKLPAQAILIESALTVRTISGHNNGQVRLDYNSSSQADAATASGTEWIGAGAKAGGSGEVAFPIYTITFAGALVASNTFDMNVNNTPLATQTFATNSNTTIAAIATALQSLSSISGAVVTDAGGGTDDDRVITVTGAVKGVEVNMDGLTVAAGSSQTTAALAQTTTSWSGLSSMPPADLDAGASSGTLNSQVHSGTASPIYRGTDATYFQVVACEDLSNASFYVGVYLKWFGSGGKVSY